MEVFLILFVTLTPAVIFAQVNVFPSGKFVTVPHGDATFTCLPLSGNGDVMIRVEWLVNSTFLQDLHLRNVVAEFSTIGNGVGTLQFTDIPLEYNMTTIRCRAEFHSGQVFISNDATILLVQGLLSAVGSLALSTQNSNICLTWTPPFSLDIDDVYPDISGYCVNVMNSNPSSLLHSQCGINTTGFSYPIPPMSWCYRYLFTVTPVNLVGNGTRATKSYAGAENSPQLVFILEIANSCSYLFIMSTQVCKCELTFLDFDTGDIITLGDDDITFLENNITFNGEQLPTNRRYNVTIKASNIAGSALSFTPISSHDVTSATILRRTSGIEVTAVYSKHSDASGVLFSFVFITDSGDVDFSRSFLLPLDRNTSRNHTLPFDLYHGRYRVYVYDIEHDGTLSNGVGYPAVTSEFDHITTEDNADENYFGPALSLIENCHVSGSSQLIRVECIYLGGSIVGFQMIVESSNTSEVHKLLVNQSTDLQTPGPVTVHVERDGEYLVSIFTIREGMGILWSNVQYTKLVYTTTIVTTTEDPTESNIAPHLILYALLGVGILLLIGALLIPALLLRWRSRRQQGAQPGVGAYQQPHEHNLVLEHTSNLRSNKELKCGHRPLTSLQHHLGCNSKHALSCN